MPSITQVTKTQVTKKARPPIVLATVLVFALVAAACGGSADGSQTTPTLSETPTGISGAALSVFDSTTADPAVGSLAPTVTGTDLLTGEQVSTFDSTQAGRPVIIGFYAHWCPHCQSLVPQVVAGLEQTPLPEGVDFVAISTFEDRTRGNHPPDAWFRREGWSQPVIPDTRGSAVAEVFGVQSVPFLVLVGADGTIAARLPGSITMSSFILLATQLLDDVAADVETDPNASSDAG